MPPKNLPSEGVTSKKNKVVKRVAALSPLTTCHTPSLLHAQTLKCKQILRTISFKEIMLSLLLKFLFDQFNIANKIFPHDFGAPLNSAPGTTAPLATPLAMVTEETPSFITPLFWPSNSPDLNPVDYKIWGILQERV